MENLEKLLLKKKFNKTLIIPRLDKPISDKLEELNSMILKDLKFCLLEEISPSYWELNQRKKTKKRNDLLWSVPI